MPDGSYSTSDIQDYFKTVANNAPVETYVKKVKNRIVFNIKAGYKLELLFSETKKLLESAKKRMLMKIKMEKTYQN